MLITVVWVQIWIHPSTGSFLVFHRHFMWSKSRVFRSDIWSDYKKELRALNRELILQFLELTDALIERPSQSARCVEDMTLILRNIHHLLNSLRPHQVLLKPALEGFRRLVCSAIGGAVGLFLFLEWFELCWSKIRVMYSLNWSFAGPI